MVTTTSISQQKPDFYLSKKDCKSEKYIKLSTNPRYKYFTQIHFTAGDEEQFDQYRFNINNYKNCSSISLKNNIFSSFPYNSWNKYKKLEANACIDTFRYIFYKFKKGIFVKIVDNQLKVFLPFSNVNFSNEWSDRIKINPKYKNFYDFFKYISNKSRYRFDYKTINNDKNQWYANNCLLRFDKTFFNNNKGVKGYFPTEGDSNTGTIKNMLEELCSERKVPDIEFFVNRRDFPIITKDGTEPYNNIWDSKEKKLVSNDYEKYLPILSMCNSDRYADMVIPTWEDWARVQSKKNIFFPNSCTDYNINFDKKWEDKIPTAVFRGSSTGCGVTIDTNNRLKLAYISHTTQADKKGIKYIDAGITKWQLRPRKIQGEKYLQTIDIDNLPFGLSEKLSYLEQSSYKYIINVDGHVSAFRLSLELNMNSVILLVDSEWKLWYKNLLKPYIHYVPIKNDLSDIIEKIKWCRKNDKQCKEIAINARNFYNEYLQKNGILDYLQNLLINLKNDMGIYLYNNNKILDINITRELSSLKLKYPSILKTINDINEIPNIERCYGLLKGIQNVVSMIIDKNDFETTCIEKEEIFKNKLGIIRKFSIAGFDFAIKTTNDKQKIKEHIHETYIGVKCINKLSKYIPNFVYIFGYYKKQDTYNVITEYIEGETLFEYINSSRFNFTQFLFILIQISLSINLAQKICGFVHYDLTPWNIILRKLDKPKTIQYIISHDKVINIKTDLIPVIIDYGKSHVIYKKEHHGFINMFKVSSIQDILTLITKSIDQIINKHRLPSKDFSNLFRLANFITNTKYRKEPFSNTKDIRNFLQKTRKYTYLISSNKYELENLYPIDLFKYIQTKIINFSDIKTTNLYTSPITGNETQIFKYILSKNTSEQEKTFIEYFEKVQKCCFPTAKNKFFNYYAAQQLNHDIYSVNFHMNNFLINNNISSEKHKKLYNKTVKILSKNYKKKLSDKNKEIFYNISSYYDKLIEAPYNEESFLIPSKINSIIDQTTLIKCNILEYKYNIELTFLNNDSFKLKQTDKKFYIKNLKNLLTYKNLVIYNNTSNIFTLYIISQLVYTLDKNILQYYIYKNNNCKKYLKKYLNEYLLLLNKINR